MDAMVEYEPRPRRVGLPGRGGAMAVLDFGPEDRPVDVVFSHANGFNGRTYRTILGPLAQDHRILALDLRGHGASTLPAVIEGRQGWTEFRDDLLALLREVAETPVVLAGHSMGGTTSLLAAAAAPETVKALALFDPVIFDAALAAPDLMGDNPLAQGADRRRAVFPDKAAALAAYTGRGAFRSWRPEQLADYVEAGFAPTGDGQVTLTCTPAWEASNFRIHNYDPWAAFRAVRCPIRMLRAESASTARIDDNLGDLDAVGARCETVPGTTHFLPMERPDLVRQVLHELVG
ncbi:alpha/beta hydrolase [Phenylobacterium sp.]|uniref:alpha/beta fold hydrolase n=1 Tax=Phenylobacterium sp. TaxID=1871053 RepID=UPI0025E64FAF|nr:alpha/beta hydrolase [Phenylobacterium sp.]MBX3485973.1 alpha/beta hydrolase [Phenylobacterium sp.]MCW5758523.1 alpha/beta hydrolase [Phenylobacterium sp.]